MTEITFVTSNDNKLREAETILGRKLTRQSLVLNEIQEMDLEKIVRFKLEQAYQLLQVPVMVEDAGLYVDAWNGFPGPFIKWLAETMGYDIFPKAVPADNRKATWRVVYGFHDGQTIQTFEGVVEGQIAPEQRGEGGWGFDPVFIPEDQTKTYSELGPDKMKFSARQRALMKLHDWLEAQRG